jgi:hypothetical protein
MLFVLLTYILNLLGSGNIHGDKWSILQRHMFKHTAVIQNVLHITGSQQLAEKNL